VKGNLYLLPNLLGEGNPADVLPEGTLRIIRSIRYFIVEDVRTARRFLSKAGSSYAINDMNFSTLNEHTTPNEISLLLNPATEYDMGIISDAGVPGVADPGSDVVRLAHQKGIRVIPLTGPSSILLAVMASGLNGQSFAFNGYLPVKKQDRVSRIKFFEKRVYSENQTQVFIETPYRNMQLFEDILSSCAPSTIVGIAVNITQPDEYICSKTIVEWKKGYPDFHKKPAIFCIGK
jgi:16S rRNA (cytidine1402-2'-O)-methyltransferase